jgi:metal-dependent HD superfamily phosphatase/phosphodiesterase
MKKNLDALIEQALDNIKNDRQVTEGLLSELQEYMSISRERYADSGTTAAKFVETLQRSNEQLVKLATLVHRRDANQTNTELSDDDKRELFDLINEK